MTLSTVGQSLSGFWDALSGTLHTVFTDPGTATGLLNLRQQILTAQSDLAEAEAQVAAQKQVNADLSDAVENSDDPDRQADIARGKLGLVEPGEYIFRFTD